MIESIFQGNTLTAFRRGEVNRICVTRYRTGKVGFCARGGKGADMHLFADPDVVIAFGTYLIAIGNAVKAQKHARKEKRERTKRNREERKGDPAPRSNG